MNSEWKERGKGDVKLLHNLQTGKYRLEMRRDTEEILCCNHLITTEMKLVLSQNNERTWVWDTTADLSEAAPQRERILARFSPAEISDEFSEVFESCPVELMN